jgi:hypothetical protein
MTAASTAETPAGTRTDVPWRWRLCLFFVAGGSIAALLADIFGIAPMWLVFWCVSVPSMLVLAAIATRRRIHHGLRRMIGVGAFAGAVGTLGYDLVRIPFALAGQRVFAPIESYGLLIANESYSSGLTSTIGWLYHLSNGVTFGIAYGAIAAGRRWPWGVLWGLTLESVAVFSPFAARYGIQGQLVPIAIAYGAHVFYGYPLGRMVQDIDRVDAALLRVGRFTVAAVLVVASVAVIGWHGPWASTKIEVEAARLSSGATPHTIVTGNRFEPEWLRIRPGECVVIVNRTGVRYETPQGTVAANAESTVCFDRPGIYRVRLGNRPYSGGFVYVDSAPRAA